MPDLADTKIPGPSLSGDFYNYSFVGKNEALFTFEAVGTGSSMVCIPLVLVLMLILTLSFPS